jgi:hypothetical protein
VTTRALLARQRALHGSKYTPSLRDFEAWLQGLAARGILEAHGDDWKPTPLGAIWLSACFPVDGHDAEAAA